MRNLSKDVEILPSKRLESHSQSENGLKLPFGVKNDKYETCHGADSYENDTLSRSRNLENDTLFSGTSPYRKIYEYPPGGFPRKGTPIVILHAKRKQNSKIGRKQITKQYSNSHPIMKIYFQIILEYSRYATSAFTVMIVKL